MSEKAFQGQIKHAATLFRWLFYHTHRSQFSPAGFPDCVMVRGPRIVYAELKAEKGKLSEDQRTWLWALANAGAEVYVWKPDNLEQALTVLR